MNEWLSHIRTTLQIDANNTGAAAIQIARLQRDITDLSEKHFSMHKHDHHSKLGLYKKISDMKAMEKYLSKTNPEQYKMLWIALGRKDKSSKTSIIPHKSVRMALGKKDKNKAKVMKKKSRK